MGVRNCREKGYLHHCSRRQPYAIVLSCANDWRGGPPSVPFSEGITGYVLGGGTYDIYQVRMPLWDGELLVRLGEQWHLW